MQPFRWINVFWWVVGVLGLFQPPMGMAQRGVEPLTSPHPLPTAYLGGTYRALVIGNNEYRDPHQVWESLQMAVNDAEAVAEILVTDYGFDDVRLLRNADRAAILEGLTQLGNDVQTKDSVLIFYAGHGHLTDSGEGFWIPVDGQGVKDHTFVSNPNILRKLKTIAERAQHTLLISDSCFSGALLDKRSNYNQPPEARYYQKVARKRSVQAMAAGGKEFVDDNYRNSGHSPFTYYFLQQLRDFDGQYLSFRQMAEEITKLVSINVEQTPEQGPLQGAGHEFGDFFFIKRQTSTTTSTTTLPPRPKPVVFQGHIQVNVDTRGTSVYLNGVYQGTASPQKPLELLHIPIGEASVEVQKKGYYSAAQKVSVRANDWIQPVFHLTPLTTTTQVTIRPKPTLPPTTLPARIDSPTEQLPSVWTEPHTGIRMVSIPGGSFQMGDLFDEGDGDEKMIRTVRLDSFWLGETEVTQSQWNAIMGENDRKPSFKGDDLPMERVSWEDAQRFITVLNAKHQGRYQFRLPSEAEWEYACREGGKKVRFGNGQDTADPSQMNFYAGENAKQPYSVVGQYRGKTVPAKSFSPNAFGLYQMSGNVWEWVEDQYTSDYSNVGTENPIYARSGDPRVFRGGSWFSDPQDVRCADRRRYSPGVRDNVLGFRLARTR